MPSAAHADLDTAALLPARIDTSHPYPTNGEVPTGTDYLGGLAWCAEAMRYFGPMVPTVVVAERRRRREWWHDVEACAYVAVYLGEQTVELLLRWLRDDFDYAGVNRLTALGRANPGWLDVQRRRAKTLAQEHFSRRTDADN